jgi:regulator-associated protein of mTOR
LTKRGPLSLPITSNGEQAYDGAEETGETSTFSDLDRSNGHHLVPRKPPDQLPIVLQVLLSQPHRLRALILLSQFVDLGPWAVHLALAIGIFPYISKLLQAAGQDLRPVLIFIWARILAVDSSCQVDLYTNQGYKYFANVLAIQEEPRHLVIPNGSEHKAMCAFILSAIARDFPHGQDACWRERVFDSCYDRLDEGDFLLRQWSALCIGQIWDSNDEIKVYGVDKGTQDKLIGLLSDESPEVRAAALFALGTFMGASGSADKAKTGGGGSGTMFHLGERTHFRMEVAVATGATLAIKEDASPMVRKELLVVISCLVKEWRGYFVVCAWIYWEEDRRRNTEAAGHSIREDDIASTAFLEWLECFEEDEAENSREENRVVLSSFFTIFSVLLELSADPYQEVATNAQTIVDYITALLLESPFTKLEGASFDDVSAPLPAAGARTPLPRSRMHSLQSSPSLTQASTPVQSRPSLSRSDTMTSSISVGVSNTIKRTSSFANALKNLAFPHADEGRISPNQHILVRPDLPDASRPPSPNLNFAQYTSPYSRPSTPSGRFELGHSPTRLSAEAQQHSAAFQPADVMEALMEEDMERLKARRRVGAHGRKSGHQHNHLQNGVSSPSGSTFSTDSSVILGLGTGVGIRDVLPLKSRCYDWCLEYFKEPQMRVCVINFMAA